MKFGFIFCLISSLAIAQVGQCKPGANCAVNTLRTNGVVTVASGSYTLRLPHTTGRVSFCDSSDNCNWWSATNNASDGLMVSNGGGGAGLSSSTQLRATTGFESGSAGAGTAFASFPTCDASRTGRLLFDSTNSLWRYCNGVSTWIPIRRDVIQGWSAFCPFAPCPEEGGGVAFLGPYYQATNSNATGITRLQCSWGTAGTGGSTGVVAQVYDTVGAAEVCSCNLGSCATAIGTPAVCTCGGTIPLNAALVVRLKSTTDCTVNPGQIFCNVY